MVDSPGFPNIYCHTKRPAWGISIVTNEVDGKRSYLFEDGEERTFAAGIALMRKLEQPDRDQQQTCAHLLSLLAKRADRRTAPPLKSAVDAQVVRFHKKYPGGFFSNEWRQEAASAFAGQARSGAMVRIQERLAAPRVAQLLETQKFADLWADAATLLDASGLASGPLQRTQAPGEQRRLAESLADLLHGRQSYDHRFEHFVRIYASVFKDSPSWQTATALPALMTPLEHVYVEAPSFRKQLKLLGLPSTFGPRPSGAAYVRCLAGAQALANMLATRGEVPRDLLDVHDFIRRTA